MNSDLCLKKKKKKPDLCAISTAEVIKICRFYSLNE